MLQISNLQKQFGSRAIFDGATLTLNSGERLALFGRNGSGKSTLLRILTGEESADKGDVSTPKGYTIGHLKQHLTFTESTVIGEACLALPGDPDAERYKAEIVLEGLGFSEEQLEVDPATLSGGFQIRINLAKLILSEPNLLLLDEPTNYLDIVSLRWLERFLRQWPTEMIVISHDRSFCDAVSTHSALVYRGGFRKIEGGSEKLYTQIAEQEELHERTRQNQEKQIKKMESFINRFRAKASKASVVQSRVKALAKIERLDELESEAVLDFAFTYADFPGRLPLEVEDLSFSYDPEGPELVHNLTVSIKKDDRIAVIGKNGRGKSTLLKLIAGELEGSGKVTSSPNTKLSFFGQTNINRLTLKASVEEEIASANEGLGRTAVRSICGAMMFSGDDALKRIEVLSGGERSRVLLGKILATPSNVLLLDEPTNHLDVESVEALVEAIDAFQGAVLIVTHNEDLLRRVAQRLIVFQGDEPFLFEGDYDDFLRRIGWDEEAGENGRQKGGSKRGDEKRERAQNVQERSRVLTPLKQRVKDLEGRIETLESTISKTQVALADASARGAKDVITKSAKELETAKRELDEKIAEWESVSQELDQAQRAYGD